MILLLDIWHRARAVLGHPNVNWCEERLQSLIEEPANTWSNLGYILAAALVFRMRKDNARLGLFAHAVLWMGIFSFVYHASNNALTQWFDFLGMFFYVGYLLTWNAARLNWIGDQRWLFFWSATLVVNLVLLFALNHFDVPIQMIVGGNTLLIFASEIAIYRRGGQPGTRYRDYLTAVFFMLIASVCSVLDLRRVWCDPADHILQGHAAWHVLGAIAVFFTARFYRQFGTGANTS